MLNRHTHARTEPEIETRAAYLFYSQINSIIPASEYLTKKRLIVFHDVYADARKSLSELKSALVDYQKHFLEEENNRKQYAIPIDLYKDNQSAKDKLDVARKNLSDTIQKVEIEKNSILAEQVFLTSNLQHEEKKLALQRHDGITRIIEKFKELAVERDDLARQEREIEARIDRKCCGFFSHQGNQDGRALRDMVAKLKLVDATMSALKEQKAEYDKQGEKVSKIEANLADVQQKIMSHMVQGPQLVKEADELVRQAQIDYASTGFEIKNNEARQYASVSAQSIDCVVRIYELFLKFKSQLDTLYSSAEKKNDVKKLNADVSFVKDRLSELMGQIWSSEKDNKFAQTLYMESRGDAIETRRDVNAVGAL